MRPPTLTFLQQHRLMDWKPDLHKSPDSKAVPMPWVGLYLRLDGQHFSWSMTEEIDLGVALWAHTLYLMARGKFEPRLLLFSRREIEAYLKTDPLKELLDDSLKTEEATSIEEFNRKMRLSLAREMFTRWLSPLRELLDHPQTTLSSVILAAKQYCSQLAQDSQSGVQLTIIHVERPEYADSGLWEIVVGGQVRTDYQELLSRSTLLELLEVGGMNRVKWVAEQGQFP